MPAPAGGGECGSDGGRYSGVDNGGSRVADFFRVALVWGLGGLVCFGVCIWPKAVLAERTFYCSWQEAKDALDAAGCGHSTSGIVGCWKKLYDHCGGVFYYPRYTENISETCCERYSQEVDCSFDSCEDQTCTSGASAQGLGEVCSGDGCGPSQSVNECYAAYVASPYKGVDFLGWELPESYPGYCIYDVSGGITATVEVTEDGMSCPDIIAKFETREVDDVCSIYDDDREYNVRKIADYVCDGDIVGYSVQTNYMSDGENMDMYDVGTNPYDASGQLPEGCIQRLEICGGGGCDWQTAEEFDQECKSNISTGEGDLPGGDQQELGGSTGSESAETDELSGGDSTDPEDAGENKIADNQKVLDGNEQKRHEAEIKALNHHFLQLADNMEVLDYNEKRRDEKAMKWMEKIYNQVPSSQEVAGEVLGSEAEFDVTVGEDPSGATEAAEKMPTRKVMVDELEDSTSIFDDLGIVQQFKQIEVTASGSPVLQIEVPDARGGTKTVSHDFSPWENTLAAIGAVFFVLNGIGALFFLFKG